MWDKIIDIINGETSGAAQRLVVMAMLGMLVCLHNDIKDTNTTVQALSVAQTATATNVANATHSRDLQVATLNRELESTNRHDDIQDARIDDISSHQGKIDAMLDSMATDVRNTREWFNHLNGRR